MLESRLVTTVTGQPFEAREVPGGRSSAVREIEDFYAERSVLLVSATVIAASTARDQSR
jgi:hypothetical protein